MLALLIFFVGFMLFSSANWVIDKFGEVTYEQIMFHLNMPFSSEIRMVMSFLKNTVMTGVIITCMSKYWISSETLLIKEELN